MDLTRYWKNILNALGDGLMLVDPQGIILSINPALEALSRYRAGELVGSQCTILECSACESVRSMAGRFWCELFREGVIKPIRCRIRDKYGRRVEVLKQASILRDAEGKPIGAVETITDLSDCVPQENELPFLKPSPEPETGFYGLLGKSPGMLEVYESIRNAAGTSTPVLIRGESGVGKEWAARAIHAAGPQSKESFSKRKASFLNTTEQPTRSLVNGGPEGSLLVDELGDLLPVAQREVLRRLEARPGSSSPWGALRLLFTSNQDLEALAEAGRFRKDLLDRLHRDSIFVPPLRERLEDLTSLIPEFIRRSAAESNKKVLGLGIDAMERILHHPWHGNCLELKNAIEYAILLCDEGGMIRPCHLPGSMMARGCT
jgi:two-component system, NtrC family, response regulator HydG